MTKEQNTTNLTNDLRTNATGDLLSSSLTLPPRAGPYRSLSAKRPRDPSHRKSVSFNDVPIVHEVPSHDAMRNSNCDTYRSWTYTDATAPTPIIPSYYTSQIFSPFNSSNAAAQKLHASRLSSSLYSTSLIPTTTTTITTTTAAMTPSANMTTTSTPTRIPEWAIRNKTTKVAAAASSTIADDSSTTSNEHTNNPSLIVVHTSDDKTNKDLIMKPSVISTYSNSHLTHSQITPIPIPAPPTITVSSFTSNHENGDEKKHPYRSALVPDTEHYRNLPFTYGPLSDSTATYTSMLSTHLIQSNHPSNEQPITGHARIARARSATLPVNNGTHSAPRTSDTVSITPFRATTTALVPPGSNASTRTVLRPTTIAFQCSQSNTNSTTTPSNTNANSLAFHTTMANNNNHINTTNLSSTSTLSTTTTAAASNATNHVKPPPVPPRYSSAIGGGGAHSRFIFPQNRSFNTAALTSSAIKYAFAHPTMDSTTSNSTISRPPPTAYPRSRSAHVLGARRIAAASPVVMLDGPTNGGTTSSTTNTNSNLYATTKRNPNVRQTYGSYYMHRVLLPTTIN